MLRSGGSGRGLLALALGVALVGAALSVGVLRPRTGAGHPGGGEPGAARASGDRPAETRAPRFTRIRSGPAVTEAYSTPSASWVDIDGDGDEDLYVLNGFASLEPPEERRPQPNALYLNDGAGGLAPVSDHPLLDDLAFSGSATWGDYDNDGDLDVFVANQEDVDNFLYRNEGDGSFVRVTEGPVVSDGGRSFSAVWVDVDGDGLLDLHVPNGRGGGAAEVDFLYRNLGDGRFERVFDVRFARDTLRSGGAAWADFDRDGDPDLLLPVYTTGEPVRLYRNDGEWRFVEVAAEVGLSADPLPGPPATSVAQWVDYDGDGHLDIFIGTTGGTIDFLFRNDGRGGFRRVEAGRIGLDATFTGDALWADIDNDGDLDVVTAVWGGASRLYLNDGEGGLSPAEAGDLDDVVTFASSVSAADIDGDGDLDLYLTQWPVNEAGGAPNLLHRNDGPTGNWLKLDLEGTASNRSAIGAVVTVIAEIDGAPRRQLRVVTARSSWRAANGLTQHVGLGDAERVDRIEVVWPSGRVDTLQGPIPVNRRLSIVEGEE